MAPLTSLDFVVTSEIGVASTAKPQGALLLPDGTLNQAAIAARTQRVRVNTGGGLVERAVYIRGNGQYPSGFYRSVDITIDLGGASIPAYEHGNPASYFPADISFVTPRGTVDIARQYTDYLTAGELQAKDRADITLAGTPGAVCASAGALGADHMTKCGAIGFYATDAEMLALPGTEGEDAARWIAHFDDSFDFHWSGAGNTFKSQGTSFGGSLTSNNRVGGATVIASWSQQSDMDVPGGTPAMQYADLIGALGALPFNFATYTQRHHMYDAALCCFQRYYQSGNLKYRRMGMVYAFWYMTWLDNRTYNVSGNIYHRFAIGASVGDGTLVQLEGIAHYFLLSSNPIASKAVSGPLGLESYLNYARVTADDTIGRNISIGDLGNGIGGEPRPVARHLNNRRVAFWCSRPFGDPVATADEKEPSAGFWLTWIEDLVDRCNAAGVYSGQDMAFTGKTPAPGWIGYWASKNSPIVDDTSVLRIAFNEFMQFIEGHALIMAIETCGVSVNRKIQTWNTLAVICDFGYPGQIEGDPQTNLTAQDAQGLDALPSFKNAFSPLPSPYTPETYSVYNIDSSGMAPAVYAYVAMRQGSGLGRGIADRITRWAIGIDDSYDGHFCPALKLTANPKQSREHYCNTPPLWGFLKKCPAAIAPTDVITSIETSVSTITDVIGTASFIARPRTSWRYRVPQVPTAVSSDPSVATVQSITLQPNGTSVVALNLLAVGSALITVSAGGFSTIVTVTVQSYQFAEDWELGVIDPAKWTKTEVIYTAAVVGGELQLGGNDPSFGGTALARVVTVPPVNLNLPGSYVKMKITRTNDPRGFVGLVDGTGKGFGFVMNNANGSIGTYVATDNTTLDTNFPFADGATVYVRFSKSGANNYLVEYSADDVTYNVGRNAAFTVGTDMSTLFARITAKQGFNANGTLLKIGDVVAR